MPGSIYDWSTTATSNENADTLINWAEFQDPDTVNNSARQMMARHAAYLDDVACNKVSTGAANIYTLTSLTQPGGAAPPDGFTISFIAHQTNGGAAFLKVDSYANIALRAISGTALLAGEIRINTPITAVYRAATAEFIAQGTGANTSAYVAAFQSADLQARLIKVGMVFPWPGGTLPGGYLYAAGQAVSRTTYSELFEAYGTTYGVGDGSTTFNLPDYKGRSLFGRDDMDGTAVNRITVAGSGINGTTLGAAGGAQTVTIAQANIPSYTLPNTIAISGSQTGGLARNLAKTFFTSGGGLANVVDNITWTDTTLSITGSVTSGGSGTPMTNMPPGAICNFIILALPSVAMQQVLAKGAATLANGLNSNIAIPSNPSVRVAGPTGAFSAGGFTAGVDGQKLAIYNTTAQAMTLVNEDASSTAVNRIKTLTGANVTLRTGTSYASFEYDGTESRWLLTSTN